MSPRSVLDLLRNVYLQKLFCSFRNPFLDLSKICCIIVPDMSEIYPRNFQLMYMFSSIRNLTLDHFKVSLRFFPDLAQIWQNLSTFRTYLEAQKPIIRSVQDMSQICPRSVPDLSKMCKTPHHVLEVQKLILRSVQDLSQIDSRPFQDLSTSRICFGAL